MSGARIWAVLVAASVTFLSGCAASEAFHSGEQLIAAGEYVEGLSKLEEASHLAPKNVHYRIAYLGQKNSITLQQQQRADAALREGKIAEAEVLYRQVLSIDSQNAMARQGLARLITERRHRQLINDADEQFRKDAAGNAAAALSTVRAVLAENPGQKEANNLKARIEDSASKQPAPVAKLAAAYRKPITLEFRDAPLKSVFDAISKISGLNFFFDKDIRPDIKATILAKDTAIEDAIKILLVTNQLEQRVLGDNAILIYPNTPAKLKDYQTLKLRTFYLANADVKAVSNTIKTLLKTQDLVVDERLGLIIMRDTAEAIGLAERLIQLQDLSDPEVMLEVEILEIKRSRLMELGVRLPDQAVLTPLAAEGQTLTLAQVLRLNQDTTAASVGSLTVNARKENQDANILANPRIRVRNKDVASILIGDKVPVITTTSTSTGFVSESVNYVEVGLKLEVEPNIYLDDEVAIKVKLEVSNLVREVTSKSGTLAYQIGTRNANTTLRLHDGETQILAGLISDEDRASANKFPGLGDLPIVGRLFGSTRDDRQRSEIVLSITPHLVRTLRRPDLVAAEFDSGTQNSLGASSLTFASTPAAVEAPTATPAASVAASATAGGPAATGAPPAGAAMESTSAAAPAVTPPMPAAGAAQIQQSSATAPPATTTTNASTSTPGNLRLSWNAPREIRNGEQFGAVLNMSSDDAVRALPLMIMFDPRVLQVVRVEEGSFLRQAGAQTSFNQRVDATQGRIFVASQRENIAGNEVGTNGSGSVVSLTFKAIAPGNGSIRLQSLTPQPAFDVSRVLPLEHLIKVSP